MNESKTKPFLQFDFKTNEDQTNPLCFSEPIKIISTDKTNEIFQCLDEIQYATANGFYAAGYISYEATGAFYPSISPRKDNKMPLLWFGIFEQQNNFISTDDSKYVIGNWQMNLSKQEYVHKFNEIMAAIKANQFEQINYTVKFKAPFTGNTYRYYQALKQAQQSKFSAYLDIGDFQILSASPELFFKLQANKITARPMKGTIHRGKTFEEDVINKTWLQTSDKNKFENKLTTELMKQELESIVKLNTLEVLKPFEVEKYPTVYQMTSTITGDLKANLSLTDIIKELFPCGSISGAPKRASLEFISMIETEAREVYCGAIGYITPGNEAVFNVPIRTVLVDQKTQVAEYGAGGAITIHSNVTEEYKEVITKSSILHVKREPFELLETFGLYQGKFLVYDQHLKRLQNSADYFDFQLMSENIEEELATYAVGYPVGKWIVRLVVSESGSFTTEINPLLAPSTNQVILADKPIDKTDIFFYHKTTHREIYNNHRKQKKDILDVLLWNNKLEITEFTIGNIVVELDGKLLTPPISSGLLPGTFREKLLNEGTISEQIIYLDELKNCTQIWLINSVRQWIKVELDK